MVAVSIIGEKHQFCSINSDERIYCRLCLCLGFHPALHHPASVHMEPKTSPGHWRPTHLQTGTKALCSTLITRLTGHEARVRPSQAGCHKAARGAAASTPRITDSSHDSSLTRGKWSATSIESARLNKSQRQRIRKGGARVKSKEAADLQPESSSPLNQQTANALSHPDSKAWQPKTRNKLKTHSGRTQWEQLKAFARVCVRPKKVAHFYTQIVHLIPRQQVQGCLKINCTTMW